MKTFRTTGTGSEQTLSEIETDKIPIYPSVRDIESDLANLEEGQIVATPDTGNEVAQPVDVVEKDNLHAVTSNAVSESLSYSTTEQNTGGYWIDGKPIYKRVFTGLNFGGGTTDSWNNTGVVIADIDTVVKGVGMRLTTTVKCVEGFFSYGVGSNGNIQYYGNHTLSKLDTLVLEYTKTTD